MKLKIMSDANLRTFNAKNTEELAGMAAGAVAMLSNNKKYIVDVSFDVSNYRIFENIRQDDILTKDLKSMNKTYGLWLSSYDQGYYNFYQFDTDAFIDGLVMICEKYKDDFVNYAIYPIFDKKERIYQVEGHHMSITSYAQEILDTEEYEEEEKDNENIIERLHKDY